MAKRDDGVRIKRTNTGKKLRKTPGSHDWYEKKSVDGRGAGARSRNMKSKALPGMDPRALQPGWKGKDGLKSLSIGITENLETTYSMGEEAIIQVNNEVKDLIKLMESKKTDEVPA